MEIAYGECHCGCGQKTRIATDNHTRSGTVRGKPNPYIFGHQGFMERPVIVQPDDPMIRYIALTQGQVAIVDASRYEWLMQWKWYALYDPKLDQYYAERGLPSNQTMKMHAAILNPPPGRRADHINGNTLDNRYDNLRPSTHRQNGINTKLRKDNTSGCRGISWDKSRQRFQVHITVNNIQINLGRYKELSDAQAAYEVAAEKLHGEYRRKQ